MTDADKPTPPSGESVSDASVDYQNLGQTLVRSELERLGYDLRERFTQVGLRADRGDLDEDDLRQLRAELDHATQLVEAIEEAAVGGDE
jgi:hypothetical protein